MPKAALKPSTFNYDSEVRLAEACAGGKTDALVLVGVAFSSVCRAYGQSEAPRGLP
jgi:hypothetical protein